MKELLKILQLGIILLVSNCLVGCMMIRGETLDLPKQWPPEKPSVMKSIVLSTKGQYLSGSASPQQTTPQSIQLIEGQAQKAYSESALFKQVSLTSPESDLRAEITLTEKGSDALAGISGFLCGFTMFIVPGYANATLDMETVFKDVGGRELGKIHKSESVSFWTAIVPDRGHAICRSAENGDPRRILRSQSGNARRSPQQRMVLGIVCDERVLEIAGSVSSVAHERSTMSEWYSQH